MTSLAVTFQFECCDLPGTKSEQSRNLRLGIQKGKAATAEVEAAVAATAAADAPVARFQFVLQAKPDPDNGQPVFTGLYAQGTPADRFVYLCWGERNGQQWQTTMRVKIPLRHLTWEQVQRASSTGQPIKAVLRMTETAGRPITATIKSGNIEWELP
jgi:hypothetical protein